MSVALERSRRLVVPELVARSARNRPGAAALAFEGSTLTFAELDERANRVAGALAARGVGPGDNVAILMFNRLEFVESFLGIQRLGACAVPVNFRLSQEEVDYVLADSRAVGILSDAELVAVGSAAAEVMPEVRFHLVAGAGGDGAESYEEALAAASPEPPELVVEDEQLAFLMYTSGTTGRPKGAMLSHQNLVVNTMNWIYETGGRDGDVWLSGLPLFHIGGLNGLLPFLALGSLAVIEPSTGFDPVLSLRRLAEHDVSMCFFVPTQWLEICERPEVVELDPARLRVAMWGASQSPLPTLELLARTFPSVQIVNAFGQTEMSSNTAFLKGEDAIRKMGSVGHPAINVEARIVDEEGVDVARGEVGEIVYRGPTVMQGYFGSSTAVRL
jgi:fatty-acyl-CoA synthase